MRFFDGCVGRWLRSLSGADMAPVTPVAVRMAGKSSSWHMWIVASSKITVSPARTLCAARCVQAVKDLRPARLQSQDHLQLLMPRQRRPTRR
jgi:hypothetical protein